MTISLYCLCALLSAINNIWVSNRLTVTEKRFKKAKQYTFTQE